MILLINVCKEKLHYCEFVKPIEKILKENNIKFFTRHYKEINGNDLKKAERVIICGTSLKDNDFLENLNKFKWLKNYEKPILGICAGMQIISLISGGKMKKETEIGFYNEEFKREFLSLKVKQKFYKFPSQIREKGKREVYHLHNNYATLPKEFKQFNSGKIPQAIKHKTKNIFGVLFHPEVRNKKMIEEFCSI